MIIYSIERKEEVRKLLTLSPEEMVEKSKGHLILLENLQALYEHFARSIADEIKKNNKENKVTRLILPVGPTGQYPILKDIINDEKISLKNCWFFFMDEYCDDNGIELPESHPLSFKGIMKKIFFNHIKPELNIPSTQIVFPDHKNLYSLKELLSKNNIDTCYGGVGIHGHVAFNEPETNVKETDPRMVYLNEYTITMNAIRANVGGNIVNFPKKALTLGMRQILSANKIRLYCRNDSPYDWANTVLRIALFGKIGDDFPVTYIRTHKDWIIISDYETAKKPKYII